MNIVQNLIAFIATISIILYFLVIARYLKRIVVAAEKIAGMNLQRIILCKNCGTEINLGINFTDQYTNCPRCNTRVSIVKEVGQAEIEKQTLNN
jgi:DNA-directed RNA polymerase subunit RPC12/RpoP